MKELAITRSLFLICIIASAVCISDKQNIHSFNEALSESRAPSDQNLEMILESDDLENQEGALDQLDLRYLQAVNTTAPSQTSLINLPLASTVNTSIIYSKDNLTYFQLTINTTANTTNFQLGKINRNVSGNIQLYEYTLDDIWKSLFKSSNLGCNAVYSTNQSLYAFILFDGSTLSTSSQIYAANLPSELNTYQTAFLNKNTFLSSDCRFLSVNGNNYYLTNNSMIRLNTPALTYTNTTMTTYGDDLYFLSKITVYKYNFVANQLQAQYLLPYSNTNYACFFNAFQNRLAISCMQKISSAPNYYTVLYILQDIQSIFQLVNIFKMNTNTTLTASPFVYSPQMTKIYRKYYDLNFQRNVILLKNIDYTHCQTYDVAIMDTQFTAIAIDLPYTVNTLSLGDIFLVIRSDNVTISSSTYLGYQFIGNTLNYIDRSSPVSLSNAKICYIKIVGQEQYNLTVYSLYNAFIIMEYYETNFGPYTRALPAQPTFNVKKPFLKLNVSPRSGKLISSANKVQSIEVFYDLINKQTQISAHMINSSSPDHLSTATLTVTGNWTLVQNSPSLSCSAFYSPINQSLLFIYFTDGMLSVAQQIELSQLPNLPSNYLLQSYSATLMQSFSSQLIVGEGCERFYWERMYSLSAPSPSESEIPFLNSSNYNGYNFLSNDLRYIINTTTVYEYSPTFDTYISAFTLNDPCQYIMPYSYNNRIIIVCYSIVDTQTIKNSIYVLVDYNDGELYLLDEIWFFTSRERGILFSEQLTKMSVLEVDTAQNLLCHFYAIDFENGKIIPLLLQNNHFCETAQFLRTSSSPDVLQLFYLGDNYIVIRNDSERGSPNTYVEEGYQFMSSKVELLESKNISEDNMFNCYKIIADQSITQNLTYYNYYQNDEKGAGYNVYRSSISAIIEANMSTLQPLIVLNDSRADGRFFASFDSIRTFEIIVKPVSQISTFKLTVMDKTQPKNVVNYQIERSGSWKTLLTANQSALSCILVYEPNIFSFLYLRYANNNFQVIKQLGITDIPMQLSNLSIEQLIQISKIGDNCSFFSANGYIYRPDQPVMMQIPNGIDFSISNFSSSMVYLVQNNAISKFNEPTNTYVSIYNFPSQSTGFKFFNYENRLATLSWITLVSIDPMLNSTIYSYTYTFTALLENNGLVDTVDSFSFNVVTESTQILINVSPKLTKIHIQYLSLSSTLPSIILKNIDFDNYFFYDINFVDQLRYNELTSLFDEFSFNQSVYVLTDRYLVIRNDSVAGLATSIYVEEGYQFVGNTLVFVGQRLIDALEMGNSYKIAIDQAENNFLEVLHFYPKTHVVPGYYIYENNIGSSIASLNSSISPPQIPPYYAALNISRNDKRFISPSQNLQTFQITYFPLINMSQLTNSYVNPNFGQASSTLPGQWSTIAITNKQLTCVFAYESYSQNYALFTVSNTGIALELQINRADLPQQINDSDPLTLMSISKLGDNCNLLQIDSNIFYVNTSSLNWISNANFSSYNVKYIILNSQVMRYNEITSSYESILTLQASNTYEIFNHGNRLIIICKNVTQTSLAGAISFKLKYAVYILLDGSNSISILDIISLAVLGKSDHISIHISPQLTKIHYQYIPTNGFSNTIVFKTIDYVKLYVFDVEPMDKWLTSTLNSLPELNQTYFMLGDQYLVVRNDTAANIAAKSTNAALLLLEVGFQFINTNLALLSSRPLTDFETGNCSKLFIDQTAANLVVFDFIPTNRKIKGYYLYKNIYKIYLGTTPASSVYSKSILGELNYTSPGDQLLISNSSSSSLQISLSNGTTSFKYSVLDRSNGSNITSYFYSFTETWTLVNSSNKLTCSLFTFNQSYQFLHIVNLNFELLGPFSFASISGTLSKSIFIDDDCNLFKFNGAFSAVVNNTISAISSNIALSDNMAHTTQYDYFISGNQIIRRHLNGVQYEEVAVFTGLPLNSACKLSSFDIEVFAICNQVSFKSTSSVQLNVTILMWVQLATLTLLKQQTYQYTAQQSNVSMQISPRLTKVYYSYFDAKGALVPIFKDIDFDLAAINDINFIDNASFIATANIWQNAFKNTNFYIDDKYIAIRNDSSKSVTNTVYVEQAYSFNSSYYLVLLGERKLEKGQLFQCNQLLVDSTVTTQMSLLVYYPKYRLTSGYRILDIRYTPILNSPTTQNLTANSTTNTTGQTSQTINGLTVNSSVQLLPPPSVTQSLIATFTNSTLSNQFIESSRMQSLQINYGSNNTNIVLTFINRNSSTNLTSSSLSISGFHNLVAKSTESLSCLVFTDSPVTKYKFVSYDYGNNAFSINSIPSSIISSSLLSSVIVVGEGCKLIRSGNDIFNIQKSASQLSKVSTPSSWKIKVQSSNLLYVIADQALYEFDQITSAYVLVSSLDSYQSYALLNYEYRLVISGFNSTSTGSGYKIIERIWIIEDGNIIGYFDATAFNSSTPSITLKVSSQLTKIYYQYININGSTIIGIKSVDYIANQLTDYSFTNVDQYLSTINGIVSLDIAHFDVGQYYMIVRNDTLATSINAFEVVYQFIGNSVMLLRSRALVGLEVGTCHRTVIDDFYQKQLVVVDYYPAYGALSAILGYNLNAFGYGNMASTIKIATHLIPPYINFTTPSFTQSSVAQSKFQWTYLYTNIMNQTTAFYFYNSIDNDNDNIIVRSFTISGVWRVISQNSVCKIMQNKLTSDYFLYTYNISSNSFTPLANLTDTFVFLNTSTIDWKFSSDCSRILIKSSILIQVQNASTTSIIMTKNWIATDSSITYAYDYSGIWKFNSNLNAFTIYKNGSLAGLKANVTLLASDTGLIIYSNASKSAYFYAFSSNGSALIPILALSLTGYVSNPNISTSSSLSKVVIYGNRSGQAAISCYYINYSSNSFENITLPTTTIVNIAQTLILIEENWVYCRQLGVSSLSNGNLELIYGLQQHVIPVLSRSQNISDYDSANWIRTILLQLPNGNIKALTQVTESKSSQILVLRLQVAAIQSSEGSKAIDVVNTVVINGAIKLCSAGCYDCSQGICNSCISGFLFDTSTSTCFPCGYNCLNCSQYNPNICYSCIPGAYLSGSSCLLCDSTCATCNGSARSCQQCLPAFFYNSTFSACQSCPRNCLSCNSTGLCQLCAKGFTLNNGTCRGCSISCSDCSPQNIMSCTACANGLQLINLACVDCPANCITCKNGKCGVCVSGYHPNLNGTCVKNCLFPCSNCSDKNPKLCISCFYGYTLNGTSCALDLSCNIYANCTDCGQGSGYFLVGTTCLKCGNIPNCIQCSQSNSQQCQICAIGYYLKNSICTLCPISCLTCVSQISCSSCLSGYTLIGSQQTQCLQCSSPCLTCQNVKTYCTSCISGYTKIGWKCQINVNVGFTITLPTDILTLLGKVDLIVQDLLRLIGKSSDEVDAITFLSFQSGSAIISGFGSVGGGASATTAATSSMSSGMVGSSIGGFPITSSTVVANGVDSTSPTDSSFNLALIIGLSIGIPVLIITIVLIIYYIKRFQIQKVNPSPQSQEFKEKHEISENIMIPQTINQKQFMSSIKQESENQSENQLDDGPNYRKVKVPITRVNQSSSMQNIINDELQIQEIVLEDAKKKPIPQNIHKLQNYYEQEEQNISEFEVKESNERPAVLNVDQRLKVNEPYIEEYETVYLTSKRRTSKAVLNSIEKHKEESELQPSEYLLSIEEGSEKQEIIFEEETHDQINGTNSNSIPTIESSAAYLELPIQNDSASSEQSQSAAEEMSYSKEQEQEVSLQLSSVFKKQKEEYKPDQDLIFPDQLQFYTEESSS